MRIQRFMVFILFILLTCLAHAQTTGALYITAPANGARVDGRALTVEFGLMPGVSAAGIPEFRVQLDGEAPLLITDTDFTLNWLSPGWHTLTVSLVDANGTPIFGAQNRAQFYVRSENEVTRTAYSR